MIYRVLYGRKTKGNGITCGYGFISDGEYPIFPAMFFLHTRDEIGGGYGVGFAWGVFCAAIMLVTVDQKQ